jgi:metallo-beta-lactamase family protein
LIHHNAAPSPFARDWGPLSSGDNLIAKLSFLGGAQTVTGSKYLVEMQGHRLLIDCGLFQGFKAHRLRNWAHFPVEPRSIEAVVLTHAHLDHSGYLPLLSRNGFHGPIYATDATADLCSILLPDSGHLQERDAEFANRHNYSKHHPALPLYTEEDAAKVLRQFRRMPFEKPRTLIGGLTARMRRAGHILGAASVEVQSSGTQILFSGDLGRYGDSLMFDPEPIERADYLVVESTYGDRRHDRTPPEDALAELISQTASRGGTILIPSFAVGRAQSLLFHLTRLKKAGRIPKLLPIFLDSPMAREASDIFCAHPKDHRLSAQECRAFCAETQYVRTGEESKALTANKVPKVIVSASGMATGGRILHHLKQYAPDPKTLILFAGFQAGGTRGAAMTAGAECVKIQGEYISVRATVRNLEMLSAHADCDEVMRWLKTARTSPRMTFVTHGEPAAADALRHRIKEELNWNVIVPEHGQQVDLT